MTTNQTIDGVPRELVRENIEYLRGMSGTHDQKSALAAKFELLLLDPAPAKDLREQYEAWADANGYDITRNEHGDYAGLVEDSMWTGWQALGELRALLDAPASVESVVGRTGGGMVWRECAVCHVKGSYHPDVKWCICGRLFEAKAAQPQGEPIYQVMYRGDGGGGWCDAEKDSYDMKVPHPKHWRTRIVYAEPPAPVAVTLQQVLKAYEYAESHPHKYLRGTTNWCAAVAHSLNTK